MSYYSGMVPAGKQRRLLLLMGALDEKGTVLCRKWIEIVGVLSPGWDSMISRYLYDLQGEFVSWSCLVLSQLVNAEFLFTNIFCRIGCSALRGKSRLCKCLKQGRGTGVHFNTTPRTTHTLQPGFSMSSCRFVPSSFSSCHPFPNQLFTVV